MDIRSFVHRELAPMLDGITLLGAQPLTSETLEQERSMAAQILPPPQAAPAWRAMSIPGLNGEPDVAIYIINDGIHEQPRPAILHMHGGGFVVGSAFASIGSLQALAQATDCVIVSVDYRLAPEARFPAALQDNYAALLWLKTNAASLGIDASRLAVMGESAGGGHAAMLAIAARDRGEVSIAHQFLVYPMLDDRTGSTVHHPPQQGSLIWTPAHNRFGWEALLGCPAGSANVPVGAVPARLDDLTGLPPTYISVGSIDLFASEDIEFASKLINDGVPCELHVVPGAFHAFDLLAPTQLGKDFGLSLINAIRSALAHGYD
jgi:acetyl esterase/lipase